MLNNMSNKDKRDKKRRYEKVTFNLPFGGFGTYVMKQIKVDGEWHTLVQKDMPVHQNSNLWEEISGKDIWFNNYE